MSSKPDKNNKDGSDEAANKTAETDGDKEEYIVPLTEVIDDIQDQHQLQAELQDKLENKEGNLNRCRYNDEDDLGPKYQQIWKSDVIIRKGYLYQQVFSCRTCYQEQIKDKLNQINQKTTANQAVDITETDLVGEAKDFCQLPTGTVEEAEQEPEKRTQMTFLDNISNRDIHDKYKIKPHGFCFACMLTCHTNCEVNELYSKMAFRCDCGNARMPESCQLYNEKEYENEYNYYGVNGKNYYDLYCHCCMPHDQESIDMQKLYMLQCFNCEDWFHNVHLNPVQTSTEIADNYLLICRNCTKSLECMNILMDDFYQFMFPSKKHYLDQMDEPSLQK